MNHYLVADIGGTNARLGLVTTEGNEVFGIERMSNKDYPRLLDVINDYLGKAQCIVQPRKACFAVASPVAGDAIRFTNNSWSFSIAELKGHLGLDFLKVINDFEAVARSIPYLGEREVFQVGEGKGLAHHPIAVLGPGTGLGMAALIPAHPKAIPLATEGGHASFAALDEFEDFMLRRLREKIGFVSNEDLLSGNGLVNIFESVCAFHQSARAPLDAATISEQAVHGKDPLCQEALERFCAILGAVAGDYALQVGAQGGVYIAGGIVPRFPEFVAKSRFRERFLRKGRFEGYLAAIPTYLVVAPQPGLIGAASVFDEDR